MVKTTVGHRYLASSIAIDNETVPTTQGDLNNHLVPESPESDDHLQAPAASSRLTTLLTSTARQVSTRQADPVTNIHL